MEKGKQLKYLEILEQNAAREPFPLPIKYAPMPPYMVLIKACVAKCVSASKKAAIAQLNGTKISIDDEIESVLVYIWNNGFNHGLKTNDKIQQL